MRWLLALLIGCGSESAPVPAADQPVTPDVMPQIPGGKSIRGVAEVRQGVSGSWCVDDANVVSNLTAELGREGWTMIETRDATGYRAMTAKRDTLRFSAQLMTGKDRCAGTVVNATVKRILEVF